MLSYPALLACRDQEHCLVGQHIPYCQFPDFRGSEREREREKQRDRNRGRPKQTLLGGGWRVSGIWQLLRLILFLLLSVGKEGELIADFIFLSILEKEKPIRAGVQDTNKPCRFYLKPAPLYSFSILVCAYARLADAKCQPFFPAPQWVILTRDVKYR